MSRRRHRILSLAGSGVAALALLTGCATPGTGAGGAPAAPATPEPPAGEVIAQGTVMDVGGTVELCLGAVAESYPPQCSGIPLAGWSWEGLDGSESSGDVTWGAYALTGTYDGSTFTTTGTPILLALYDPMAPEDPTGGEPGQGTEEELAAIQDELAAVLADDYLSSYSADGWLRVDVVWDDGTWQSVLEDRYGPDRVIVQSALRETTG